MVLIISGDLGFDSIFCLSLEIRISIERENKWASIPLISKIMSSLVNKTPGLLTNKDNKSYSFVVKSNVFPCILISRCKSSTSKIESSKFLFSGTRLIKLVILATNSLGSNGLAI